MHTVFRLWREGARISTQIRTQLGSVHGHSASRLPCTLLPLLPSAFVYLPFSSIFPSRRSPFLFLSPYLDHAPIAYRPIDITSAPTMRVTDC